MILQLPLITAALVLGDGSQNTSVVRWSNPDPVNGTIVEVDEQGIQIRVGDLILPQQLPWYDIREIEPAHPDFVNYRQIALDAWRAHTRLERGDYPAAEDMYQHLADRYLWKRGLESADVSFGLMLCMLELDDRAGAVLPFLSWIDSQPLEDLKSESSRPNFDPQYGLMTELPPVFGPLDHISAFEDLPDIEQRSKRQRAFYEIYRLAYNEDEQRTPNAELIVDQIDEMLLGGDARDAGFELMKDMVTAQAHPQSELRQAARDALRRRAKSKSGTWVEMWARLGLGVSLLNEQTTEEHERGIIELIHVIVRFENMSPRLARTASQIANEYLEQTNRSQWGSELLFDAQNAWMKNGTESALNMESATDE